MDFVGNRSRSDQKDATKKSRPKRRDQKGATGNARDQKRKRPVFLHLKKTEPQRNCLQSEMLHNFVALFVKKLELKT